MQIQPQVGRRSYENVCADVQTIELWFSTRSETRREAEQYYPEQMDGVTWCSTCASLRPVFNFRPANVKRSHVSLVKLLISSQTCETRTKMKWCGTK